MVEKKIKALQDFQFTNFTGTHYFTKGEVKRIRFHSKHTFEDHLKAGLMVEAEPGEEEGKPVEVLYPPDVEDVIVLVDPVDLIDPPEGIDPDKPDVRGYGPNKPDLPSPEKDHISTEEFLGKEEISLDEAGEPEEQMTDEDEMRSEPHVEILEPPQTADSVEEILPEGATEMSIDRVSVEECDSEEERK